MPMYSQPTIDVIMISPEGLLASSCDELKSIYYESFSIDSDNISFDN